jgi:hypothetical protein
MRHNTWFDRATGLTQGAVVGLVAAIAGIVGLIALIVVAWAFIIAMFVGVVGIVAVWWALGGKITIKKNDRPVGYLRWLTYHHLHEH